MAKKILLIEDDLDIQRIYSEKLTNAGYAVTLAVNGDQGLTQIKNETPNLVLLDIMLPGTMNGFELLEIIKKDDRLKNVPVVVLTNLDTEKDQAMKIGANDYLLKVTLSLEDLVNKANKYAS